MRIPLDTRIAEHIDRIVAEAPPLTKRRSPSLAP